MDLLVTTQSTKPMDWIFFFKLISIFFRLYFFDSSSLWEKKSKLLIQNTKNNFFKKNYITSLLMSNNWSRVFKVDQDRSKMAHQSVTTQSEVLSTLIGTFFCVCVCVVILIIGTLSRLYITVLDFPLVLNRGIDLQD